MKSIHNFVTFLRRPPLRLIEISLSLSFSMSLAHTCSRFNQSGQGP